MKIILADKLNDIVTKEELIEKITAVFQDVASGESEIDQSDWHLIQARATELKCKTEVKRMYSEALKRSKINSTDAPFYVTFTATGQERISPELLASYIEKTEHYFFVQSPTSEDSRLFWYKGGVYKQTSRMLAKAYIKDIISKYNNELATIKAIDDTLKQLEYSHSMFHTVEDDAELNSCKSIINFQNGLLYLDDMELRPHTTGLKSTIQIPCNWTGKDINTPVFDAYISHLTNYDEDTKACLLEIIGAALSNIPIGAAYKKSLFIIGDGNTGKSQLPKLLALLIGQGNCTALPFSKLEERFQTANLYNKRLAIDDDCRSVNSYETSVFKTMTGGGQLQGEMKGKTAFTFVYNGLYIVLANDKPLFGGDKGDHVYDRIIPIKCGEALPEEKRDPELLEKLFEEREGIIFKAIHALKRSIDRGYKFAISASSETLREEYKITNDSCLQFLEECCIPTSDAKTACTQSQMWDAFTNWCKKYHEYQPKRQAFRRAIAEKAKCQEYQIKRTSNGKHYYPFTLTAEAKTELNIYDSIQIKRTDNPKFAEK